MFDRIRVESGHAQAVREQVERDFIASIMPNCGIDLMQKIFTQYINFRDGKAHNRLVDAQETINPDREMTR